MRSSSGGGANIATERNGSEKSRQTQKKTPRVQSPVKNPVDRAHICPPHCLDWICSSCEHAAAVRCVDVRPLCATEGSEDNGRGLHLSSAPVNYFNTAEWARADTQYVWVLCVHSTVNIEARKVDARRSACRVMWDIWARKEAYDGVPCRDMCERGVVVNGGLRRQRGCREGEKNAGRNDGGHDVGCLKVTGPR